MNGSGVNIISNRDRVDHGIAIIGKANQFFAVTASVEIIINQEDMWRSGKRRMQCHAKQASFALCCNFGNSEEGNDLAGIGIYPADSSAPFGHPDKLIRAPEYFPGVTESANDDRIFNTSRFGIRRTAVAVFAALQRKKKRQQKNKD